MNARAVFFGHRPPVNRQQIQPMPRENLQQRVELRRALKPDARLHGERPLHRAPQHAEEFVHARQVAEQAAARALAINDRCGAAEIEIDRRDGVFFESLRHAGHRLEVVADDLRHRRTAGGIFHDRTQNRFLGHIVGRHAEILGEIQIRPAVARHQPPERPVRDVLHRRERQNRPRPAKEPAECLAPRAQIFVLIHRITPPSTGKCS